MRLFIFTVFSFCLLILSWSGWALQYYIQGQEDVYTIDVHDDPTMYTTDLPVQQPVTKAVELSPSTHPPEEQVINLMNWAI